MWLPWGVSDPLLAMTKEWLRSCFWFDINDAGPGGLSALNPGAFWVPYLVIFFFEIIAWVFFFERVVAPLDVYTIACFEFELLFAG